MLRLEVLKNSGLRILIALTSKFLLKNNNERISIFTLYSLLFTLYFLFPIPLKPYIM